MAMWRHAFKEQKKAIMNCSSAPVNLTLAVPPKEEQKAFSKGINKPLKPKLKGNPFFMTRSK
ncbi:hypothetical protein BK742_17535 [Bacillus thuringiensis serovar pingluonsis]|uniref:Uncharacterized protein n=1 Tax=Bacillus thuringiensis serovar pingluonsis TaxID=180881 RepID=A0A243B9W3_BACTU|nr:hypothetical protein BK742_17535 [Bacillus thuringiensis serovar pingluonsis]